MDSPQPRRFTYQDLELFDPEKRWELIDGTPYSMSGASLLHQSIVGELHFALKKHFANGPCRVVLAPFDVKFSDSDVVQPDLLVSCNEGLGHRFQEGPPELVVEVLSPSTIRHDKLRKLNLYAREGVPEYWLVTPNPLLVEVLENRDGFFCTRGVYDAEHCVQSIVFPELQVELGPIQAALPPQPPIEDEVRETVPTYGSSNR